MKSDRIRVLYRQEMCPASLGEGSESKSPLKPRLLLEYLDQMQLMDYFEIDSTFTPFANQDFYIAHTQEYVDGFFQGQLPHSNGQGLLGIDWSPEYADSTRYTNASLYHAIRGSIQNPSRIYLSPTSGFHHSIPAHGALFCAFSGQVIAALKIYEELGLSGAFIDLDGHFGNSIEDSRYFAPTLNKAIPPGCNINIRTEHTEYLQDLQIRMLLLQERFLAGQLHYLVFCHGADSHEEDDIGHQLNTEEWMECAHIFARTVQQIESSLGRPIPVSLALFGGYREDDYNSVLSLHTGSLLHILKHLSGIAIEYWPAVSKNLRKSADKK
ncbi:hypothetical protein [Xanthocytophaga flava]|uniref:hypothetical protein n=1 Tax=Xanthocytophaga flava TaxID=3048013 RepID=UPI0028D5A3C1|nr:hypothetical protein [Xanthocytophaga flavus]MDJ1471515.1 hypothetical protein [Xanthocytophaga flavus]